MKRLHFFSLGLLSLVLVAMPVVAVRAELIHGQERVYFAADRVVDDNIIVAASDVDIQSRVLGDVIVAGGNVKISGDVEGDVFVAGGQVDISSAVHGSIWVVGGTVHVSGIVDQNVRIVGGNVAIASSVHVGRNVAVAGGVVDVGGEIDRRLDVAGGLIKIAAIVNGNVHAFLDSDGQLTVNPPAEIAGNLSYVAARADQVQVDSGVAVGRLEHLALPKAQAAAGSSFMLALLALVLQFFWLAVMALFLRYVAGRYATPLIQQLLADPVRQLGLGLLLVIGVPLAVVILMITIIGLPLAVALLLIYIVYWLLAPAVVAMAIGQWVMQRRQPTEVVTLSTPYLLWGVAMVTLVSSLSWVGLLVHFLVVLWGLGGLAQYKWKFMRSN